MNIHRARLLAGICLGALAAGTDPAPGQSAAYNYDQPGNLTGITAASGPGPVITGQPVSQLVSGAGNVYFSVLAAGSGPFTYQWLSNGVPITSQW